MREGGSCAAGGDIALEGVSAGAFRVLLRYLYTQELPGAEDGGEGLATGEMAKAADYFQAGKLHEHCVEQFKGGLRVGNVVERLVQAHDSGVEALVKAAMDFLKANALSFQVSGCGDVASLHAESAQASACTPSPVSKSTVEMHASPREGYGIKVGVGVLSGLMYLPDQRGCCV